VTVKARTSPWFRPPTHKIRLTLPAALSILFAGTPEFSVPALEALLGSRHRVRAVYTQPDRPAGRGQHVAMSAVKQCALKHGVPVEQPATLRDPPVIERLAHWQADVMIVVAYGLILPPAVLAVPPLGCINIHASLLPRWRGAAPIQRAILAGDAQSGVTIMRMEAGLDTGPVLLERSTPLAAHETAGSLHDRLAASGAAALLDALEGIADGSLAPRAQPEVGVTYAAKINKQEALIDWSQSARAIDRQVRAFNPWPVAETRWKGQQLRVWDASPEDAVTAAAPGTVIAADATGIRVATGAGSLNLTRVQIAGRKAVAAAEFINAHHLDGALLGPSSSS
jgi:methionyl-tRNA formyltransferase